MPNATMTSDRPGGEPLETVLRPSHDAWIEETRRFLTPALDSEADFWTRWSAVRYISDDFREQFRLERALVAALRPLLREEVANRLMHEGERVVLLRLELDRIGRRRGTSAEFAAGADRLLEQMGVWCAEIELAARGITREALPAEGAAYLAHLEAVLRTRR
ncbi:MAG TPA: hypothetical protein VHR41_19195 [Gemmatimonadales bacterium]|nr:hypothetical protein [Gemmatimonadales bacterium]